MTWGQQRKTYILIGISLVFIIPIIIYLATSVYEKPNCFDGIQNQEERGIDCGGQCQLICRTDTVAISTVWSRVFEEGDLLTGSALIENKNSRALAVDVPYKFSIFKGELELSSVEGVINIPPKQRFPLIVGGLVRGIQDIDYHKFEIGEPSKWIYENVKESPLLISRQVMDNKGAPRISASVKNTTFEKTIKDSYFVVFVYDEFDSVIKQSTTYIKELEPQESKEIFFTWNEKFEREPIRFDVIELKK